jgi:hypothetical protein
LQTTSNEDSLRECRHHFRCAAQIPVLIVRRNSGFEFRCTATNLSRGGIGLKGLVRLDPGERIYLIMFLQETVKAFGTVVWGANQGTIGISLETATIDNHAELDAWLNARCV